MSSEAEKNAVEIIKTVNGKKKQLRHPPLRTAADVRRELARLYWAARRGEVDISDASKLGHLLGTLGRLTISDGVEQRLQELEDMAARLPTGININLIDPLPLKNLESRRMEMSSVLD